MVSVFDWIIIIAGLCGLLMVVGAFLLLYKGAIKLSEAPMSDAVSVEFKKTLKITTGYPALGLFIIGLTFIISAAFFSKPGDVQPITLKGKVEGADPSSVKILVSSDTWASAELDSSGMINKITYPDMNRIYVQVIAAGCVPPIQKFTMEVPNNRILQLPKISFEKIIANVPPEGKIVQVPKDVKAPSLTEEKKF